MTSHEYARAIKESAEFLLSRPEFEVPRSEAFLYLGNYYTEKDKFLAAVRALGSGKKVWEQHDLTFTVTHGAEIDMRVSRSAVCRKVQEEKWECEPLLSPEEEAAISG